MRRPPPIPTRTHTLFPYTTLFRSNEHIPTYDDATRIQGESALSRGCRPDKLPGLMDPSLIRHMPDPFVMVDMERAARRLASAIKDNETILVFGDYDVDGATSADILRRFLKMACATNVVTHVPYRDKDRKSTRMHSIHQGAYSMPFLD